MNYFKNISRIACLSLAAMILFTACQKLDKPELGNNYPKDSNPPGGPLKFYVAFDGTTSNPSMNAVDSIRASFASDNPLTFVDHTYTTRTWFIITQENIVLNGIVIAMS